MCHWPIKLLQTTFLHFRKAFKTLTQRTDKNYSGTCNDTLEVTDLWNHKAYHVPYSFVYIARPEAGTGIVATKQSKTKTKKPHLPVSAARLLPNPLPRSPLLSPHSLKQNERGRSSRGKTGAASTVRFKAVSLRAQMGSAPDGGSADTGYLRRSGAAWTSGPPCRGCSPSRGSPASWHAPRPHYGTPRTARGRPALRPRPPRPRRPRPRRRSDGPTWSWPPRPPAAAPTAGAGAPAPRAGGRGPPEETRSGPGPLGSLLSPGSAKSHGRVAERPSLGPATPDYPVVAEAGRTCASNLEAMRRRKLARPLPPPPRRSPGNVRYVAPRMRSGRRRAWLVSASGAARRGLWEMWSEGLLAAGEGA